MGEGRVTTSGRRIVTAEDVLSNLLAETILLRRSNRQEASFALIAGDPRGGVIKVDDGEDVPAQDSILSLSDAEHRLGPVRFIGRVLGKVSLPVNSQSVHVAIEWKAIAALDDHRYLVRALELLGIKAHIRQEQETLPLGFELVYEPETQQVKLLQLPPGRVRQPTDQLHPAHALPLAKEQPKVLIETRRRDQQLDWETAVEPDRTRSAEETWQYFPKAKLAGPAPSGRGSKPPRAHTQPWPLVQRAEASRPESGAHEHLPVVIGHSRAEKPAQAEQQSEAQSRDAPERAPQVPQPQRRGRSKASRSRVATTKTPPRAGSQPEPCHPLVSKPRIQQTSETYRLGPQATESMRPISSPGRGPRADSERKKKAREPRSSSVGRRPPPEFPRPPTAGYYIIDDEQRPMVCDRVGQRSLSFVVARPTDLENGLRLVIGVPGDPVLQHYVRVEARVAGLYNAGSPDRWRIHVELERSAAPGKTESSYHRLVQHWALKAPR